MSEVYNKDLSLFPQEIQENEVLYVIGNGFDIAHGIKSKYSDFRNWCGDNVTDIGIFDCLFNTREDFWNDIEHALGNYDEEEILDFCKPDEEFDLDHSLSSSARIEDAPMSILEPALEDLKKDYIDWVNSINLEGINENYMLYKNAKYISFNYTETLEKIYSISHENICHIHGCRLFNDNKYIFGHNNYKDTNGYDVDMPFFEENAIISIFEYMNAFKKPMKEIIKANAVFFEQLKHIKLFFILGHSISEVDMPYFDYLLSIFIKQPKFIFSANNKKDCDAINKFIMENKISQYKIIKLDELLKND